MGVSFPSRTGGPPLAASSNPPVRAGAGMLGLDSASKASIRTHPGHGRSKKMRGERGEETKETWKRRGVKKKSGDDFLEFREGYPARAHVYYPCFFFYPQMFLQMSLFFPVNVFFSSVMSFLDFFILFFFFFPVLAPCLSGQFRNPGRASQPDVPGRGNDSQVGLRSSHICGGPGPPVRCI